MASGEKKAVSLDGTDKVAKVEADPKIVAGQLMGINKELIELGVWIAKKLSTVTMNLDTNLPVGITVGIITVGD